MSTISASTTSTTGFKVTSDTTGTLVFQTGASPTTAMTLGSDQSVTFAGTPTYSGGTANGVAYLNGSKVFTTGTALVFDGSNLGVGTASPAGKLDVAGTIAISSGNAQGLIRRTTVNGSYGVQIQGNTNDTRSDTYPGASIAIGGGPVTGDAYAGRIELVAYGNLTDSTSNIINFQRRTGVNTVAESARFDTNGYFLVGGTSTSGQIGITCTNNSLNALAMTHNGAGAGVLNVNDTSTSYTGNVTEVNCSRSQNSAYSLSKWWSGGYADVEFNLRGDGNGYADGTWNNNGADYAEFFESTNGLALTVGATVVLEGNKVRQATSQDAASAVMGVVRPKEPSKASMVIGNTAWNKWADKYLTDDFDRYIMEDHDVLEWTDEEGKQHSYESHNIPTGVVVPDDAVRSTHDGNGNKFQHYKLNPAWNPDVEYVNRENRAEWNIIGLLGQVKILKGQPVGDRWVKMRDVSESVEEWMIR